MGGDGDVGRCTVHRGRVYLQRMVGASEEPHR